MATSAQTKVVKLFEIHPYVHLIIYIKKFNYILDHVLSNLLRHDSDMNMYGIIVKTHWL